MTDNNYKELDKDGLMRSSRSEAEDAEDEVVSQKHRGGASDEPSTC